MSDISAPRTPAIIVVRMRSSISCRHTARISKLETSSVPSIGRRLMDYTIARKTTFAHKTAATPTAAVH